MAQPDHSAGRHRDLPQAPAINLNSSVAGGSGTDYEHVIYYTPSLAQNAASGTVGDLPNNAMNVRYAYVIFEGTLTGQATNNFTLNILQRRGGALLVNTTSSTAVAAAGAAVITPASMANIVNGSILNISGGTGTPEQVTAYNVTPTTFTAVFANTHSGTYNIVSVPLATITYGSGVNETAFVAHQFAVPMNRSNTLVAGDVVTIQRISNGTGLAHPALTVGLDLVPSGIYN